MKLVVPIKQFKKQLKEQLLYIEKDKEKAIEIIEEYSMYLYKKKKGKIHDLITAHKLLELKTRPVEYENETLIEVKGKVAFRYQDTPVKINFTAIYDKEYGISLDEASFYTIEFQNEEFTSNELNLDSSEIIDRIYELYSLDLESDYTS